MDISVDPSVNMLEGAGTLETGTLIVPATSFAGTIMQAWREDPRAVWTSFSMIVVSEIGDKTFLIAAILAMRQSRTVVFSGALGALALMSVLSACMGVLLPALLPRALTTFMAACLFVVFGVRMLREGMRMRGDEINDEWEEAQREVEAEESHDINGDHYMELGAMEEGGRADGGAGHSNGHANGHANGGPEIRPFQPRVAKPMSRHARQKSNAGARGFNTESFKDGARNLCGLCFSPVFAHAFVLTFLGEWGDRSQIATIALAAAHNIALVSIGTIAGHALCTSIAVLAGRWVATRISVKHVMLSGACLFLLFGLLYGIESLQELVSGRRAPMQDYQASAVQGTGNPGNDFVAAAAEQQAQQLKEGVAPEPPKDHHLGGPQAGVQFEDAAPVATAPAAPAEAAVADSADVAGIAVPEADPAEAGHAGGGLAGGPVPAPPIAELPIDAAPPLQRRASASAAVDAVQRAVLDIADAALR